MRETTCSCQQSQIMLEMLPRQSRNATIFATIATLYYLLTYLFLSNKPTVQLWDQKNNKTWRSGKSIRNSVPSTSLTFIAPLTVQRVFYILYSNSRFQKGLIFYCHFAWVYSYGAMFCTSGQYYQQFGISLISSQLHYVFQFWLYLHNKWEDIERREGLGCTPYTGCPIDPWLYWTWFLWDGT